MIRWLKSLLFQDEIKQYSMIEKRIVDLEASSLEVQCLVVRQSELLAAVSAVQFELISAIASLNLVSVRAKGADDESIHLVPDDDEFIN
jgi:hypothetical protein